MAFQNLGQVFVRSFLKAGISKIKTYNYLRRWGLSYGRAAIYKDYNLWKKVAKQANLLKYVKRKARPTQRLFIETTKFMMRRYKYAVRVNLLDNRTGEIRSELRYVRGNRAISRGLAEQKALKSVRLGQRAGYYDILSYRLEEAWHREGDIW